MDGAADSFKDMLYYAQVRTSRSIHESATFIGCIFWPTNMIPVGMSFDFDYVAHTGSSLPRNELPFLLRYQGLTSCGSLKVIRSRLTHVFLKLAW